jgi:hypothetical protein
MTLRKGREPSQSIEALAWYSQFDTSTTGMGATVQDLQRRQAVVDRLRAGMDESLANEARLHGWRVQNLFEAMIVCLGSIRLIKTEDSGSYYYDEEEVGPIKPPDFRVVRSDGQQVLIEVKNVDPRTYKEALVNERDLEQKQQYADLMATRLLLAHYWSAANHWSVVDPRVLERRDGKLVLRFETAMMANELGLMGDLMIGTRPPLTLSLIADPSQPQRAWQISATEDELGFAIGRVELSCGGQVLTQCHIEERDRSRGVWTAWAGRRPVLLTERDRGSVDQVLRYLAGSGRAWSSRKIIYPGNRKDHLALRCRECAANPRTCPSLPTGTAWSLSPPWRCAATTASATTRWAITRAAAPPSSPPRASCDARG